MRKKAKLKSLLLAGFLLPLLAFGLWFWTVGRVPEPKHNGVGLGHYLTPSPSIQVYEEGLEMVQELGPRAVPYLLHKTKPDPIIEFLSRFDRGRKLPAPVLRWMQVEQNRRTLASAYLSQLGTNALPALPDVVAILERPRVDGVKHNCVNLVGQIAAGTPYEHRAVQAVLRVIEESEFGDTRRVAYYALGAFTNHSDQTIPALLEGLKHGKMVDNCIEALKRIGQPAIAPLEEAAAKETRHVRPAGLALEKVRQVVAEKEGPE